MSEVVKVDLTPFVCEVIAANKRAAKLVSELYMKDAVRYYQTAQASKWYDSEIIAGHSLSRVITGRRVLGMIEAGALEEVKKVVMSGWHHVAEWVSAAREPVSVSAASREFLPDEADSMRLDMLTNDEINAIAIMTILLSNVANKEIDTNDPLYQVVVEMCLGRVKLEYGVNRLEWDLLDKKTARVAHRLRRDLNEQFHLNNYVNCYAETWDKDIYKWNAAIGFLFDLERISFSVVEDEVLSGRDMDEVISAFVCVNDGERPDMDEVKKFLVAGHIIRALLRAYRRDRDYYFRGSKEVYNLEERIAQQRAEELEREVDKLRRQLEQRKDELRQLKEQTAEERKKLEESYARTVKKIKVELERAREGEENWRRKAENLELELVGFLRAQEDKDPDVFTPEVDLSLFRGVIIGGHQRWAACMREVLPGSWKVIAADDPYEQSMVAAVHVICFVTGYISHSLYKTVMAEARRRKIPVVYLSKQNEDECVAEIKRRCGDLGMVYK